MGSRLLTPRASVVGLGAVILGAALLQAAVTQLQTPAALQYLVIGLSAIAMVVALVVVAYVLRGATHAERSDDLPAGGDGARDRPER